MDLAQSYTLSGAKGVMRGIALTRGSTEAEDGALILDEFDASGALAHQIRTLLSLCASCRR